MAGVDIGLNVNDLASGILKELEDVIKNLDGMEDALKKNSKALSDEAKQEKRNEDTLKKLSKGYEQLKKEFKSVQEIRGAVKEMEQYAKICERVDKNNEKARESGYEIAKSMKSLANSVGELVAALKVLNPQNANLVAALASVGNAAQTATETTKEMGQSVKQAAQAEQDMQKQATQSAQAVQVQAAAVQDNANATRQAAVEEDLFAGMLDKTTRKRQQLVSMTADESDALSDLSQRLSTFIEEGGELDYDFLSSYAEGSIAYLKAVAKAFETTKNALGEGDLQVYGGLFIDLIDETKRRISDLENTAKNASESVGGIFGSLDVARSGFGDKTQLDKYDVSSMSLKDMKNTLNDVNTALSELTKREAEETEVGEKLLALRSSLSDNIKNFGKSTDSAKTSILHESDALRQLSDQIEVANDNFEHQIEMVPVESMSYNELSEAYKILKDNLNSLTQEQIRNTQAGQSMQAYAKEVYNTMDMYQRSTGKFSLSVGQYERALGNLKFQVQQVLREVPSALNLQQFFLAISNNLPMLGDEIKKWNQNRARIHEAADEAIKNGNKQLAEEMQKQYNAMGSSVRQVIKSLLSWQTILIMGITLLRKYGAQAVEWIGKLFKGVLKLTDAFKALLAVQSTFLNAKDAIKSQVTELGLINKELKNISQGTDKWESAVKRVNEITGSTLDILKATPAEIAKVTAEFIKQQKRIAVNKEVVGELAKNDVAAMRKENFKQTAANFIEKYGKSDADLEKGAIEEFLSNYSDNVDIKDVRALKRLTRRIRKADKRTKKEELSDQYVINHKINPVKGGAISNIADKYFPTMSDKEREAIEKLYKVTPVKEEKKGSVKAAKEDELDLMDTRWYEQMKARARVIEDEFEREIALQNAEYAKMIDDEEKAYDERLQNFEAYASEYKLSKETYDAILENIHREHADIVEGIEAENTQALLAIQDKYEKEDLERLKKHIDEVSEEYDARLGVLSRRVRNAAAEMYNNSVIDGNIRVMREHIDVLERERQKVQENEEANRAYLESIEKIRKEMEKEVTRYSVTKQLDDYEGVADIMMRNTEFSGDMQRGVVGSLLGEEALDNMSEEQIGMKFDEWADAYQKNMKDMTGMIKDNLSEMLDAYVEFYEKRAEAAAEDTEAAKEEYERQKSFLDAGYANSVDTAWEEYQQKKEIQRQAEQDAIKAQRAQQAVDDAVTVSNMIVAIANLFKNATATKGLLGVPLAATASAAMLGSFIAAKIQAAKVARVQYGDGHAEMIGGGSHASGHDSPLAFDNKGRERRVEGGEIFGVVNRRAVRKYGAENIMNMINSLNGLNYNTDTYDRFTSSVDLSRVERSLDNIREQGDRRVTHADRYTIISEGNTTKRIYRR